MDPASSDWETVPVLLCGGGPVGELLSNLLARLSVTNVVLEKDLAIPTDPRAFSIGEDGVRLLQAIGLYDHVYTDIGAGPGRAAFVGGRHTDLKHPPFLSMNADVNSYTGHLMSCMFKQPRMEKHLRDAIEASGFAELRVGCCVKSIEQDEEWVYVKYDDVQAGKERCIRARFLVGTDGKTGYTRKQYLEPKGVLMEKTHAYEEIYVGMNWDITPPTPTTHPDFPLFKQGYSPEDVMDAFIPKIFVFIANPDRPGAASRIGVRTDNPTLWRTEFAITDSEDPNEMSTPERAPELIRPYMTQPGSRYGVTGDVTFPPDCMKLRRTWYYKFQARTCNKWHVGRVMLAGDAAHVFPPFGGQGILSGFMDAAGLAWRLYIALHPSNITKRDSVSHLLSSWSAERKQHIDKALAYTVHNGDLLTERNPFKIFLRDWSLWLLQLVPSWKRAMERLPLDPVKYTTGAFLGDMGGGVTWPQVYCTPLGEPDRVAFTDDAIFRSGKGSLFQLVALLDRVDEVGKTRKELENLVGSAEGRQMVEEATYIVHQAKTAAPAFADAAGVKAEQAIRVASADEFAASKLCTGRVVPQEYDEGLLKRTMGDRKFVVVRPDRFVFAACRDTAELARVVEAVQRVLSCESV